MVGRRRTVVCDDHETRCLLIKGMWTTIPPTSQVMSRRKRSKDKANHLVRSAYRDTCVQTLTKRMVSRRPRQRSTRNQAHLLIVVMGYERNTG
jgi:hypothetical protein